MPTTFRKRRLTWPITLSVSLMALNIALMVCWIVLLAHLNSWGALTIGTIIFALILVGLSIYLALTVKEVRLNQQQVNFVDSVTHELKSPIASLRLYLETLQMRELAEEQRREFYGVMEGELSRLDNLISHLLEVSRLDALGEGSEPEDVLLEPLLRKCAETACAHHKCDLATTFEFHIEPTVVRARRMILEIIFGNLLDNSIKYAGEPPVVDISVKMRDRQRVVTRITDNGEGVPAALRKRIFKMFYRGGRELERRRKGTGLGLYITRTLVQMLKGQIRVHDRVDGSGSVFEVELPGRMEQCES